MVGLRSAIFLYESAGRFAHLFRRRVVDVNAIDDTDHGCFDRHVLIANRRSRCLAESAHHHFAGSRAEPVGNYDDVASRLLVEIVWMHNQESDALEIGRFLRRPNCAYDFC